MDFSRLEAGKMQATFVPVNVADFTEDLTDLFRAAMDKVSPLGFTCSNDLILSQAQLDFQFQRKNIDDRTCFIDPDLWEKVRFECSDV
jgi:hypothetical protein